MSSGWVAFWILIVFSEIHSVWCMMKKIEKLEAEVKRLQDQLNDENG